MICTVYVVFFLISKKIPPPKKKVAPEKHFEGCIYLPGIFDFCFWVHWKLHRIHHILSASFSFWQTITFFINELPVCTPFVSCMEQLYVPCLIYDQILQYIGVKEDICMLSFDFTVSLLSSDVYFNLLDSLASFFSGWLTLDWVGNVVRLWIKPSKIWGSCQKQEQQRKTLRAILFIWISKQGKSNPARKII